MSVVWIGSGYSFNWVFLRSRNPSYRSSSHLLLIATGVLSCLVPSVIPIATRSCWITNAFPAGVYCFGLKISDSLKDDEYTGKSGEASQNDNGNQSCIVFENALFSSRYKIIFQAVRVGTTMMALTETVSPRRKVIQTGYTLEWV